MYLEIKSKCNICGAKMVFIGLPVGMSPHQPMGDLLGHEARLPIIAEGEEYDDKAAGVVLTGITAPRE